MTDPIGTYTFLPWLRQGVANRMGTQVADHRATIDVSLDIEGQTKGGGTTTATVQRTVALYGPGDVIGIESAMISRIEPQHWVTNFEPNYLAAIEFYDEDFPWRYTPAQPQGRRLLPWLALIVLEETTEFKEAANVTGRPLPFIEVTANFADVFPDPSEGWAWAHAHFNASFSGDVVENDGTLAAQKAQQVIDTAPDTANSRLLCPRKLKPKTAYHAFLIPAFESGRLAGLGIEPKPLFDDAANALTVMASAWGDYAVPANRPDATLFPVYHRWYFRTAERGDFESLVRLLKPQPVDPHVGHRDMDVTDPAPNIVGINNPELGGILRLGGALKAPLNASQQAEFDVFDKWATPYPQPFQSQLAAFVNLAERYQADGPGANDDPALEPAIRNDPDPLITPPIYGRWHALTERLLTEPDGSPAPNNDNWVHDLNLDPRWRTAAGFGTGVVQQNQEDLMEAAWDQIGDVLEANRRIRAAQLAKQASAGLYRNHVVAAERVSAGRALMLAAPVQARLISNGVTVRHQVRQSPMSCGMASTAMRRALRPGGRTARKLALTSADAAPGVVTRANARAITAAAPKAPLQNILTPDELADAMRPTGVMAEAVADVGSWLDRNRTVAILGLLVSVLLVLLLVGVGILSLAAAAAIAAATVAVWIRGRTLSGQARTAASAAEAGQTPESVDELSGASGFELVEGFDPREPPPKPPARPGETDNPTAVRFKAALRDQYRIVQTARELGRVPAAVSLDLPRVARDIVVGLDPKTTVPRWALSGLDIPQRIRDQIGETFVEAMAYPEFDMPMYEPLVKAGDELFVPNLHLVPPDSITLLETNQKFIEAYMVGLNHEFARELLWREYPTDQRGSYFRQFWDVRKKLAQSAEPDAAREQLKDIKPLHRWSRSSDLGDHDNREAGPEAEEEVVLVIRGELLKKYPNTIVSAQPAKWRLENGQPDKSQERELDESVTPIAPLYEAKVAPDLYFFGFDLTAEAARGDDTVDDKPGWFFRIEEVPGDARFGFDISRDPADPILVWNDLAWADVVPNLVDGKPVKVADIPHRELTVEPTGTAVDRKQQWDFDKHVAWDPDGSAAELAYIALQTPVIMAVHASELLPEDQGA